MTLNASYYMGLGGKDKWFYVYLKIELTLARWWAILLPAF